MGLPGEELQYLYKLLCIGASQLQFAEVALHDNVSVSYR